MGDQKRRDAAATDAVTIPDHQMLRRIGDGSYGEVWLARSATGTLRAVKVVQRRFFDNDKPFEREFNGLLQFEPLSRGHEGLVDILQVGRNGAGDSFYCIMELADDAATAGGSPKSEVRSPKGTGAGTSPSDPASPIGDWQSYQPLTLDVLIRQRGGRLPARECLAIASTLASALQYLHEAGLAHRDIKPSNIIFVGGVPKLADVGLVARTDSARTFVGTEGFVPPEGPGTPRADIYSLGKCLYEMAMGKDRQAFPSPPTLLDELPDREELLELNEVITKACDPELSRRYASATAFLRDLELLRQGPGSLLQQRRRTRYARATAWAGLVLGVGLGIWLMAGQHWTSRPQTILISTFPGGYPPAMQHPLIRINPTNLPSTIRSRVALVNPDYWRILKCAILDWNDQYRPAADGALGGGQSDDEELAWSGVGQSADRLAHLLANGGQPVDVFWSTNFPHCQSNHYRLVIVQDPLTTLDRTFSRQVEAAAPDLLDHVTDPEFLRRLTAYHQSGGTLVLMGDAIRLLENGPGRLNHGLTVHAINPTNSVTVPHSSLPTRWMFVRGQYGSGRGPTAELIERFDRGSENADGNVVSRITIEDRVDAPRSLVWGETFYVPLGMENFARFKQEGFGEYWPPRATVAEAVATVSMRSSNDSCGWVHVGNRTIGCITSDAPLEFNFREYLGAEHFATYSETRRTLSVLGEAVLREFLSEVERQDRNRQANLILGAASASPATFDLSGHVWQVVGLNGNGCEITGESGEVRIQGTTIRAGWGQGNYIATTNHFPVESFEASIEFFVPRYDGPDPRLIYFGTSATNTRNTALLYIYGRGCYQVQQFVPNQFFGELPGVNDPAVKWRTLTIRYNHEQQTYSGFADGQWVGTAPLRFQTPPRFNLTVATDQAGTHIDVRFRNFTYRSQGTPSAPPETPTHSR